MTSSVSSQSFCCIDDRQLVKWVVSHEVRVMTWLQSVVSYFSSSVRASLCTTVECLSSSALVFSHIGILQYCCSHTLIKRLCLLRCRISEIFCLLRRILGLFFSRVTCLQIFCFVLFFLLHIWFKNRIFSLVKSVPEYSPYLFSWLYIVMSMTYEVMSYMISVIIFIFKNYWVIVSMWVYLSNFSTYSFNCCFIYGQLSDVNFQITVIISHFSRKITIL